MVEKGIRTRSGQPVNSRETLPLIRLIRLTLLVPAAALVFSCAEVAAPPGGEEDTIGPSVVSAEPADGATLVPISDRVTIHFSERILRPTTGNSVAISPRPSAPPKLKWGSDHLTVILPDSFQANRTYTISLTSGITDLRRKSIEGKSSLSFSTGAAIDSGHLGGTVLNHSQPAQKVTVGLYAITPDGSVALDSVYPVYQISTDKDGAFTFSNVSDGPYRLIAFDDQNRNEFFDPAESFALPDRAIQVGGNIEIDSLYLQMQSPKPDSLHIVDATITNDRLIKLRLNKSLPIDSARLLVSGISLHPVDPPGSAIRAAGFLEQDSTATSLFTLDFGALPVGVCSLFVSLDETGTQHIGRQLTLSNNADSDRPRLLRIFPWGKQTQRPDSLVALFSEPILRVENLLALQLIGRDSTPAQLSITPLTPFSFRLSSDKLRVGERYTISIDTTAVADRAGNPIIDTLRRGEFRILPPDSLGSATGTITNLLYPDSLFSSILRFASLQSPDTFTVSGRRDFSIPLPPGKYLISAFVDRNLDGQLNPGRLSPFEPAEQFIRLKDTVAVRPRFETSGIEVTFR